ncbi:hypothetical protein C0993_012724 [Termitomyces sp. T159_Od127]|nr:hypothetical protein C0993_012724 [Termitomyces sp. T159_Od127]
MSALPFKLKKLPLDPTLYSLDANELAFFQEKTGIHDEQELKQHIIAVQEKAYEVSLATHQNHTTYWNYGHELFRSTPETFPAVFIQGDAFDSTIISPREPFYAPEEPRLPDLPLKSLTSLAPLQGRLNVVYASSFFHLFDEAKQLQLARQLATLLSTAPGSMIFGSHRGEQEKGLSTVPHSSRRSMFCHSPETWKELWDGQVFKKGTVKVEAGLCQSVRSDDIAVFGAQLILWWAVTRL